jgi:hypothetical protein
MSERPAAALAGWSLSVTVTVQAWGRHREDPGRRHVHGAVAAEHKITVSVVFEVCDAACS